MEYHIIEKQEIEIVGAIRNFEKCTTNAKINNYQEKNIDIWLFWDEFLNKGMDKKIGNEYKLYRPPFWRMCATQKLDNGENVIAIGAEADGKDYKDLDTFKIPASTWVVFETKEFLSKDNNTIESLMKVINTEWLPTNGYEKSMNYEIQVYCPEEEKSNKCGFEVWIPVRKRKIIN